jgi:hypothetical protein
MIHLLLLALLIGAVIAAVARSSSGPHYDPQPGWYADPWQLHRWQWFNETGRTGYTKD